MEADEKQQKLIEQTREIIADADELTKHTYKAWQDGGSARAHDLAVRIWYVALDQLNGLNGKEPFKCPPMPEGAKAFGGLFAMANTPQAEQDAAGEGK